MLLRAIGRNGLLLAVFSLLATAAIAITWTGTRVRIAEQQRAAAERALLEIVPLERHENSMLDDVLTPLDPAALRLDEGGSIHIARSRGEVVAAILPVVAPDGYSGRIELIVGVNRDGSVAGVRVLSHRETPGLGDKVDLRKSDWILGFNGRSLQDPGVDGWAVRKDGGEFDQFTGATITPRAVVTAVHRALQYFAAHRAELIGETEEDRNGG